MILPDVNLLIYAHNTDAAQHETARTWWEESLSGTETVSLAWVTLLGFVRMTTSRVIMGTPWRAEIAVEQVERWLAQPNVRIAEPGPQHAELFCGFIRTLGTAGNLTTDAHLAALAVEHGCTLYSVDADFSRFKGLKWRNPVATAR